NERLVELLHDGVLVPFYFNFVYEALREANGQISGIMSVGNDVTAQVQARHNAEEGGARFRLLADSMPQFVWTGDANGALNYFNSSVYAYSGLSKEQVERDGWIQIVHPEDRDANVKAWVQSVESGQDFHFEHRFKRHDGEYRWQLSRALPLRNAEGQITMWVGTSTDIQELKQQEKEKDYFISMVSHELRTPLSTLKGYVQMLQSDYGDGSDSFLVEALKVMDRQVTSLTGIISDLLDLSRMQTGVLELELEPLDMDQVIARVIEEMHYSHPSHTISFRSGGPAVVSVDRNRITQVLQNYLTNAVKYAPDSFDILIDSQLMNDQVKITVTDHGIGIRKPDLAQLFQRFYRVEGHSQRSFSGFGIGLHIVADLVRRHGGTVG
ncbi:MAG: PAS domain-containing sensor histidine kinase, partial [Bacteroidota bacterium]|nr:PAS domain-containing sensor histidine kinase [Bacteroidota bacterium]